MKKEDQVASVKPAKELKELGAKQDSVWYWTWAEWNEKAEWVLISQDERVGLKKENFSAYTVAELGEMLPIWVTSEKNNEDESLVRSEDAVHITWANTEADARAKMVIYLIKEGIIET